MVLHHGEYYLVAGLEKLSVARCHQVNRLGRASCKNNLVGRVGVDKRPHPLPRCLHGRSGFLRQRVYATVHIGAAVVVGIVDSVDNHARCLARGSVVKVD